MSEAGIIASINPRGFGFIRRPGAEGANVFFHASNLDGLEFSEALRDRHVQFEIVDGLRGKKAVSVRPVVQSSD